MKVRIAIAALVLGIATTAWALFDGVTTTVTSSWTEVCRLGEASQYANIQFRLKNTGTTNPLTDCVVETWLGPLADTWVTYDANWTACKSLASGDTTIWEIMGSAHEKLRVLVKSAVGTTTYCKPLGTR